MITIIASFEIKPEGVDEFKKLAAECIEGSRREEGNIEYNLHVSKNDPNKFFFIENWKDEKAIELHNSTPHFKKFASAFVPLLAKKPVVELAERL